MQYEVLERALVGLSFVIEHFFSLKIEFRRNLEIVVLNTLTLLQVFRVNSKNNSNK